MAGSHAQLTVAERRRLAREQAAGGTQSGPPARYPVAKLAGNPANRRESLDEIDGLADTVERDGFLQSFGVVPAAVYRAAYPEFADREDVMAADYIVVNGNRRLEVAQRAGVDEVPILVNSSATTRRDIARVSLVENVQRLALKPMEEAEAVEDLIREFGTAAAVSREIGKSEGWISQRRRLLNLAPEFRTLLGKGELKIEEARELGKTKDHDEQRARRREQQETAVTPQGSPGGKAKSKGSQVAKRVPAQAGASRSLDTTAAKRHEACATAVELVAVLEDISAVTDAALLLPGSREAAEELAGTWLAAAHSPAPAGDFVTLLLRGEDAAARRQASLAIALALCELHAAEGSRERDSIDGAYLGWLTAHCGYEPSDDERQHLKSFTA